MTSPFTAEHELFRKQVRTFCEKELAPNTAQWEEDEMFPAWVFKRAGELGILGAHYPEDVGGAGGDYWYSIAKSEEYVRIGSAGKTFSLTGWKVGYVSGPEAMIRPIAKAHQLVTFTTPPNLQHAVALGLGVDATHYAGLAAAMAPGRARLAAGLRELGVEVIAGDGTYFLVADVEAWMRPDEDDVGFARRLVTEAGVVVIPMSAFYGAAPPRTLVRFCFCKELATIEAALARLAAWRRG